MNRASGTVPEAIEATERRPDRSGLPLGLNSHRGRFTVVVAVMVVVTVDRSRLAVGTVVGSVSWTRVAVVMCLAAVAVAARLLVPGVDVSATGADAAGEQ